MKNRPGIILPIIFCMIFFIGCSSEEKERNLVASSNGRNWTVEDARVVLKRVSELPGQRVKSTKDLKELIGEMVRKDLLLQEALESGFVEESSRIREFIAQEFLNEKIGRMTYEPTEKEVREIYEREKADLDQVHVAHILIKPENESAEAKTRARIKAEQLLVEIKNGADFSALAKAHSSDKANAQTGGDLGFAKHKSFVEPFSNAAFSLSTKGELSPVVETVFGFHIIQMLDAQKGLDYWRPRIIARLQAQKKAEIAQKLFSELEKKFDVRIFDENLKQIQSMDGQDTVGEEP